MKAIAGFFLQLVFKLCLSLRYRVEVKGVELLTSERLNKKGGTLFFPNHPAQIETLILLTWFWPKFRMRPLAVEYVYRLPFLRSLMRLTGTLPIPNFDTAVNPMKLKQANEVLQKMIEGLKRDESFLLYPAGNLKNEGRELLRGSSAAHSIVQECPNANIVLIRTTGLWGSSFSRAILGRTPDLWEELKSGINHVFKNGIFFSPRRKITIEIEPNPSDFPRSVSRVEFNRYLENWYNRYPDEKGNRVESEPLYLVSYSCWKEEYLKPFEPKKAPEIEKVPIPEKVEEEIYAELRHILNNPGLEIKPEMSLAFDLGLDSLNLADLGAYVSKRFEMDSFRPEAIETVQDVLEVASGAKVAEAPPQEESSYRWPAEETGRPPPLLPEGKTLPDALLHVCRRMGNYAAFGDDVTGILSFLKVRRAVFVLAEHFRSLPDSRIAVVFPASAAAFIVILALQCAGKVPVMLNWTLGPKYLEEMMKLSGANRIITSWRFMDRLPHVDFGSLIEKMEFLEDIRSSLSWITKWKGALAARVTRSFSLQENDPCVILFTSGTEALPKCVPLSHKNILNSIKGSYEGIEGGKVDDCAYATLPPFHSFGFAVTALLGLFAGIKMCFFPDPTNSRSLALGIERWKVTIFPSPPSFIRRLLNVASDEQLKSIRLFISGAEKAPEEVLNRIDPKRWIEGYGITECSATVSIHRPSELPRKGLGKLISDYELCTIHPESLELLPEGGDGEICLRGSSVFEGYIGSSRSPFLEIQGKKWYRTGDLGRRDSDGILYLSGRLKRFTKLGGEMISLGAVEETLIKVLLEQGKITPQIPALAICSDEQENPRLILFTTIPLEVDAVNDILRKAGFSNLIKIAEVRKIDEIPLLATGKMDYRQLQSLLKT